MTSRPFNLDISTFCPAQHEDQSATIAGLRVEIEALHKHSTSTHTRLAEATTELELSGKVVQHLELAQAKHEAEIASLRSLLEGSARNDAELLTAIQSFKADKTDFVSQRDDHERELRGTVADLQQRLENTMAETTKAAATADAKIGELEARLVAAADRVKSFPSRYESGGELVRGHAQCSILKLALRLAKTEEECIVIQEIMRHCQRSVEQQLVTKGNDIRRVR